MKNSEEKEVNKKRKNKNQEDDSDLLALSLCYRPPPTKARHSPPKEQQLLPPKPTSPVELQQKLSSHPKLLSSMQLQTLFSQTLPPIPLQFPPTHPLFVPEPSPSTSQLVYDEEADPEGPSSLPVRSRRNPSQGPSEGKSETIPAPFPWATNRRATVHSLDYLLQNRIFTITGDVQCKRCERKFEMGYDLKEKFAEVWNFIVEYKSTMHDRGPEIWMNPILPNCKHCGQENSVKPLIVEKKKKSINWLFLLLGQMLGCCTLEQLKYFCKHTKNHRTGAKDRVLYLTYLGLCKQLDPKGPFDR